MPTQTDSGETRAVLPAINGLSPQSDEAAHRFYFLFAMPLVAREFTGSEQSPFRFAMRPVPSQPPSTGAPKSPWSRRCFFMFGTKRTSSHSRRRTLAKIAKEHPCARLQDRDAEG